MFHYDYFTEFTCSKVISLDLDGKTVHNVVFTGGCDGNLKMIAKIVDGWTVDQIAEKMSGNTCGRRPTSCADQLAKAVLAAYEASQQQKN